ncbi:hypothetical protein G9C98_007622 [Cotesia typhae]|uniref:Uncharacterized protein n=1 Tax=Cotesia typhae TaxID=2053667 RepID=A0A8J5UWA4_9HYME|nr:hypothetical protein G9C98_007622 [Cotesia typhae]
MDPWPLKSRALTPNILWYQDDGSVVLRIMLIDVDKFFLDIDLERLKFSKYKNPQITMDKEKYEETVWTLRRVNLPEWDSIEEYKRRNNIVNILPADDSNDESDDERDAVLSD